MKMYSLNNSVQLYLKEVQGYLTVFVCVHGVKCFWEKEKQRQQKWIGRNTATQNQFEYFYSLKYPQKFTPFLKILLFVGS